MSTPVIQCLVDVIAVDVVACCGCRDIQELFIGWVDHHAIQGYACRRDAGVMQMADLRRQRRIRGQIVGHDIISQCIDFTVIPHGDLNQIARAPYMLRKKSEKVTFPS